MLGDNFHRSLPRRLRGAAPDTTTYARFRAKRDVRRKMEKKRIRIISISVAIKIKPARNIIFIFPREGNARAPLEFINKTLLRRGLYSFTGVTGRIGTPEIIRRRNVDRFTGTASLFWYGNYPAVHFPSQTARLLPCWFGPRAPREFRKQIYSSRKVSGATYPEVATKHH